MVATQPPNINGSTGMQSANSNQTKVKRVESDQNVPQPPPPPPLPGGQQNKNKNKPNDLQTSHMQTVLNANKPQQTQRNWENAQQKYNKGQTRPVAQDLSGNKTDPKKPGKDPNIAPKKPDNPQNGSRNKPHSTWGGAGGHTKPPSTWGGPGGSGKPGPAEGGSSKPGPSEGGAGEPLSTWGGKKRLDRSDSKDSAEWKKSLPILQIPIDIGEGEKKTDTRKTSKSKGDSKSRDKGQSRGGQKESPVHIVPDQSEVVVQSKGGRKWGTANQAYQSDENSPKDAPQASTSYDKQSSHTRSHDNTPKSHRRQHGQSGEHRTRSKSRDYKQSSKSRESSGGRRSSIEDFTAIDYVTGKPLDKDRKRSHGDHRSNRDPRRESGRRQRSRSSEQPRRSHVNHGYEADEYEYRKKASPENASSHSEASHHRRGHSGDRHRHRDRGQDYYENYIRDQPSSSDGRRHRKPHDISTSDTGTSMTNFSRSTKNSTIVSPNFTININAQPGAAIQLGFGQPLPPAGQKPMIEASPAPKLPQINSRTRISSYNEQSEA